jgi:hypothetical protein
MYDLMFHPDCVKPPLKDGRGFSVPSHNHQAFA